MANKGYVLTDENNVITGVTGGNYGGMYIYEGVSAYNVLTTNSYHMLTGCSTGSVQNFTFTAGTTGSITAYADYGGTVAGTVKATCTTHGLSTGDIVSINGTTNYNGIFSITKIDNNEFYFTDTWVANDATGTFARGCSLTAATTGVYLLNWSCSCSIGTANKVFQFEPIVNTTQQDRSAAERAFSSTDVGVTASHQIVSLTAGDKVAMTFKNQTDVTDITFIHFNLTVHKIL